MHKLSRENMYITSTSKGRLYANSSTSLNSRESAEHFDKDYIEMTRREVCVPSLVFLEMFSSWLSVNTLFHSLRPGLSPNFIYSHSDSFHTLAWLLLSSDEHLPSTDTCK